MFKAFEFCIPTRATIVPDGPAWLHEVKYDGFRLRVERDGNRVRLITRSAIGNVCRSSSARSCSTRPHPIAKKTASKPQRRSA
jgi:hypothetical protein